MDDSSGSGRILDKSTGEALASVEYSLRVVPPPPGRVVRSIDLQIDMPWRVGMEAQRDNKALVLETAEGKYQDFWVTTVSQDAIGVRATGGPRDTFKE